MIIKVWCLISGGILVMMGMDRCVPEVADIWEIVVLIGVITSIIGAGQVLYDYGKTEGMVRLNDNKEKIE